MEVEWSRATGKAGWIVFAGTIVVPLSCGR
jgi:hypothetical protein